MESKQEVDKVKYNCLTDESIVFEVKDWSTCSFKKKDYKFSSNNQHHSGDGLLAAECAVFSGNLLRFILGPQQPEYYLARNQKNTKFYRVSQQLENYNDWLDVVKVNNEEGSMSFQWENQEEEDILDVKIVGLIDLFVACHFLGEADWEGGNFGFVKVDNTFVAVRLDPGFSFNSFIIDNNDINLESYIDNFVINYLTKEIANNSEDEYLSEIIDHQQAKFKNPSAETLFSNRERIISVIRKIAEIKEEDLEKIKQRSFSSDFTEAEKLIEKLLRRRELYADYLNQLGEEEEAEQEHAVAEQEENHEEYDDLKSVGEKRKRQVPIRFFDQSAETSSPNPSAHTVEKSSTNGDNRTVEKPKRARTENPTNKM